MKTEWLQSILAVDHRGSIAEAATELQRAAGVVRQHLASVEQEVGITLFSAQGAALIPTPAGNLYLAQARRLLDTAAQAAESARAIAAGRAGTLRLGIPDELATPKLAQLIRTAQQRLPQLRIVLQESSVAALPAAINQHRVDLALLPLVTEHRDVVIEPLWDEPWRVVLPPQHPLRGRARIECADLAGVELVLSHPTLSPCGHDLIRSALSAAGVTPLISALVLGRATMLTLVSAGVGTTFVPGSFEIAPRGEQQHPGMVPLNTAPMRIVAAYHADQASGAAMQFLRIIREGTRVVDAPPAPAR